MDGVQGGVDADADADVDVDEEEGGSYREKSIFTFAFLKRNPWSPERKINEKRMSVAGCEWNVPWHTVDTEPRTPASESQPMSLCVTIVARGEGEEIS